MTRASTRQYRHLPLPGQSIYCQSVNASRFSEFLTHLCVEAFCPSLPPFLNAASYALQNDAFAFIHSEGKTTLRVAMFQSTQRREGCTSLLDDKYDTSVFDFLLPFLCREAQIKSKAAKECQIRAKSALLRMEFPSICVDEVLNEIRYVHEHIKSPAYEPIKGSQLYPLDVPLITYIFTKYIPIIDYQSFDVITTIVFIYRAIALHLTGQTKQEEEKESNQEASHFLQDFNPLLSTECDYACTMQTSLASQRSLISFECQSEKIPMWSFSTISQLKSLRSALYFFIQSGALSRSSTCRQVPFRFDTVKIPLSDAQQHVLWSQFHRRKNLFAKCFSEVKFDEREEFIQKESSLTFISARPWRDAQKTCFLHTMDVASAFSTSCGETDHFIRIRQQTYPCVLLLLDDFIPLVTEHYVPFTEIAAMLRRLWLNRLLWRNTHGREPEAPPEFYLSHAYENRNEFIQHLSHRDLSEICRLLQIDSKHIEHAVPSAEVTSMIHHSIDITSCSIWKDNDLFDLLLSCFSSESPSSVNTDTACPIEVGSVRMFVQPPEPFSPTNAKSVLQWQRDTALTPITAFESLMEAFQHSSYAQVETKGSNRGSMLDVPFVRLKKNVANDPMHMQHNNRERCVESDQTCHRDKSMLFPFYEEYACDSHGCADINRGTLRRMYDALKNTALYEEMSSAELVQGTSTEQGALREKQYLGFTGLKVKFFKTLLDGKGMRNEFTASMAEQARYALSEIEGDLDSPSQSQENVIPQKNNMPTLFQTLSKIARSTSTGLLEWLLCPFPSLSSMTSMFADSLQDRSNRVRMGDYDGNKFLQFMHSYIFFNATIKLAALTALYPTDGLSFGASAHNENMQAYESFSKYTMRTSCTPVSAPKKDVQQRKTIFVLNSGTTFQCTDVLRLQKQFKSYYKSGLAFSVFSGLIAPDRFKSETLTASNLPAVSLTRQSPKSAKPSEFDAMPSFSEPRWFLLQTAHSLGILHFLHHVYTQFSPRSASSASKMHVLQIAATLTPFLNTFLHSFYAGEIRRFLSTPYCFCLNYDVLSDTVQFITFAEFTNRSVRKLQASGAVDPQMRKQSFVQLIAHYQPMLLHRIVDILMPRIGFCPLWLLAGAIPQFSSFRLLQYIGFHATFTADFAVRESAVSLDTVASGDTKGTSGSKFHAIARKTWCGMIHLTSESKGNHSHSKASGVNLIDTLPHPSRIRLDQPMKLLHSLPYPLSAAALLEGIMPNIPSYFVPITHITCTLSAETRKAIERIGVYKLQGCTNPTHFFQLLPYTLCPKMRAQNEGDTKALTLTNASKSPPMDVLIRRCEGPHVSVANASFSALDKIIAMPEARQSTEAKTHQPVSQASDASDWIEYKNAPFTAIGLACSLHIASYSFRFDSNTAEAEYAPLSDLGMCFTGGSLQYLMQFCPFRARGLASLFPSLLETRSKQNRVRSVRKQRHLHTEAEDAFTRDTEGAKRKECVSLKSLHRPDFLLTAQIFEAAMEKVTLDFFSAFPHIGLAAHRAEDNSFFDSSKRLQEGNAHWDLSTKCHGSYIAHFPQKFVTLKLRDPSLTYSGALRFASLIVSIRIAFWSEWEKVAADKQSVRWSLPYSQGAVATAGEKPHQVPCLSCYLLYPGAFPVYQIGRPQAKGLCICREKPAESTDNVAFEPMSLAENKRIANLEAEFTDVEFRISNAFRAAIQETGKKIAQDVATILFTSDAADRKKTDASQNPRELMSEVRSLLRNVFSHKLRPLLSAASRQSCATINEDIVVRTDGFPAAGKYFPTQKLVELIGESHRRTMGRFKNYVLTQNKSASGIIQAETVKAVEASPSSTKPHNPTRRSQIDQYVQSKLSTKSAAQKEVAQATSMQKSSNVVAPQTNKPQNQVGLKTVPFKERSKAIPHKAKDQIPAPRAQQRLRDVGAPVRNLKPQFNEAATPKTSGDFVTQNASFDRSTKRDASQPSTPKNDRGPLQNAQKSPEKVINTFAMNRKPSIKPRYENGNSRGKHQGKKPPVKSGQIKQTKQYLTSVLSRDCPREKFEALESYIFHCGSIAAGLDFEGQRMALLHWMIKSIVNADEQTRADIQRKKFPVQGVRPSPPLYAVRLFVDAGVAEPFMSSDFTKYATFCSVSSIAQTITEAHVEFLQKYYNGDFKYFCQCHARIFVLLAESAFQEKSRGEARWFVQRNTKNILKEGEDLWLCIPPKSAQRTDQILNIDYFYFILQTFIPVGAAIQLSALMPFFHGISEVQFQYFFAGKKILRDLFFGIDTKVAQNKTVASGNNQGNTSIDTICRRSVASLPPFLLRGDLFSGQLPALTLGKKHISNILPDASVPEPKILSGIPNALFLHRNLMHHSCQILDALLPHVPSYLTPLSEIVHAATWDCEMQENISRVDSFIRHNTTSLSTFSQEALDGLYKAKKKRTDIDCSDSSRFNRLTASRFGFDYLTEEITRNGFLRLAGIVSYFDDTKYENENIPNLQVVPIQYYPAWMDANGELKQSSKPVNDFLVSKKSTLRRRSCDAHFGPVQYHGYQAFQIRLTEIAICVCHHYWTTKQATGGVYDASWYLSVGEMLDVIPECLRVWMLHECHVDPQWVFDSYPLLFEPYYGESEAETENKAENGHLLYKTRKYRSRVADHLNVTELKELFVSLKTFLSTCEDENNTLKNLNISSQRFSKEKTAFPYQDGEEPDEPLEAALVLDEADSFGECVIPIPSEFPPHFISIAVPTRCTHFDKVYAFADLHKNFTECRAPSDNAVIMSFAAPYWQPDARMKAQERVDAMVSTYLEERNAAAKMVNNAEDVAEKPPTLPDAGKGAEVTPFTPCALESFIKPIPGDLDMTQWIIGPQALHNETADNFAGSPSILFRSGEDLQTELIEHASKLKIVVWLYRTLMSNAGASGKLKAFKTVKCGKTTLQLAFSTAISFLRTKHSLPADLSVFFTNHAKYKGEYAAIAREYPVFFYYQKDSNEIWPAIPSRNDAGYVDMFFEAVIPHCGWVNRRVVNEVLQPLVKAAEISQWMETNDSWKQRIWIETQKDADIQVPKAMAERNTNAELCSFFRTHLIATDISIENSTNSKTDASKQWISRKSWRLNQSVFQPKTAVITSHNQEDEVNKPKITEVIDISASEKPVVATPAKKAKAFTMQTCCTMLIRFLPLIDTFFDALPAYFIPFGALCAFFSAESRALIEKIGFRDFVHSVIVAGTGMSPSEFIEVKTVTTFTGASFANVLFVRRAQSADMRTVPAPTAMYPGFGDLASVVLHISQLMFEIFGGEWVSYATLVAHLPRDIREWLGYACPYTLPALCRVFPRLIACSVADPSGKVDTNHADGIPVLWYKSCAVWNYDSVDSALRDAQLAEMHTKLTPWNAPQGLNSLCLKDADTPMFPYPIPVTLQSTSDAVRAIEHTFADDEAVLPPILEFSSYFLNFTGKNALYDETLPSISPEKISGLVKRWADRHVTYASGSRTGTELAEVQRSRFYYWEYSSGRQQEKTEFLGVYRQLLWKNSAPAEAASKTSEPQGKQKILEKSLTEYDDDDDFEEAQPEERDDEIEVSFPTTCVETFERFAFFDDMLARRGKLSMESE